MTLGPVEGLSIKGMATVWPEDLTGPSACMADEDVYAALLGNDWKLQLDAASWDYSRTERELGVRSRSWTRDTDIDSIDLAIAAAEKALADAGMSPARVDCIIVATCTPTHVTSTIAAKLAKMLGTSAAAIDIRAGGAGAINAVATAASYHATGCGVSLVVAAEVSSKYLGEHDLSNALLFGDGAAAVVIESDSSKGGLAAAVIGNSGWSGIPFTVSGTLPPEEGGGDFVFQRPDDVYRRCLADSWREATNELRNISGEELLTEIAPYAVTRTQLGEVCAAFELPGKSALQLLEQHGCTGCVSPLAAMIEHWQQCRNARGDFGGEVLATLAVAGGISWSGLIWRS